MNYFIISCFIKDKKQEQRMSEGKQVHPLVVICQTLICLGSLATLITGIVFLSNPEQADRDDPERAVLIGTILTAIGGSILGCQVLCLAFICCCGGMAMCAFALCVDP